MIYDMPNNHVATDKRPGIKKFISYAHLAAALRRSGDLLIDEVVLQIEATPTGVALVIDPRYHQALGGRP